MIANDNVDVTDDDTVGEFEVFSKIGSTWKASRDHDDLAMSTVDVTAIFDHPYFDVMMEEVMGLDENQEASKMYEKKMDEKYGNLYDNYNTLAQRQELTEDSDYNRYRGTDFGGYFGKTGIYN
jgi:hypothetical protein